MSARYVDQAAGKRKGSFAIYLVSGTLMFLIDEENHGNTRCVPAIWFMLCGFLTSGETRAEAKRNVASLFCPNEAPVFGRLLWR